MTAADRPARDLLVVAIDRLTADGTDEDDPAVDALAAHTTADRAVPEVLDFVFGDVWLGELGDSADGDGRFGDLSQRGQGAVRRCRLFLTTDLPYEWPPPRRPWWDGVARFLLLACPAAGLVLVFLAAQRLVSWWVAVAVGVELAGAFVLVARAVGRHYRWAAIESRAVGDWEVWPFFRRADYEAAARAEPPGPG